MIRTSGYRALPLLMSFLVAWTLSACDSDNEVEGDGSGEGTTEGSADSPAETVTRVEPAELPPPPPPAALVVEPAEDPAVNEPADGLTIASRFRRRDRMRRHVSWTRSSTVAVEADQRAATAVIDSNVETVYLVDVTAVEKGALETVEVRFESFVRTISGSPTEIASDPRTGEVWTCRTDRSPPLCATAEEESRGAPPWLVLSFDPLLPARRVRAGEGWSRRVGVAPLFGLSDLGVARAAVTAEAPYETTDGIYSTLAIRFEGDDRVRALGRIMRATVEGNGAAEFDLRQGRVVAYDIEWAAEANAERRSGDGTIGYDRVTTLVLRMTELPTQ